MERGAPAGRQMLVQSQEGLVDLYLCRCGLNADSKAISAWQSL